MLKCSTESFIIKKKKNVGIRIFNQNIRFSVLFENILFSLILGKQSVDMDQTSLNFKIFCGLRGFHVYSDKWKPRIGERISIVHEKRNIHDINAMAGKKTLPGTLAPTTIEHLPKEISRYTRYIIEHGAQVCAFVISTTHRVSPLIQGGLEIPIRVEIKLPYDEVNDSNLKKYKQLVEENYRDPVNGKYDDATDKILKEIGIDDEESEEDSDVEELYELDNSEKDD